MSLADSEPTFAARALQYGLPQSCIDVLQASRLATFSALLFHVASAPNKVEQDKVEKVFQSFPVADRTDSTKSAVNRLLFEAGTLVVAELKSMVETPEDAPRKLSPEERASRLDSVRTRLGSWPVGGQFEPSHALVDSCAAMIRDQAIRYIPPSRCSSRDAEVTSVRRDDSLIRLENNALKVGGKTPTVRVDLTSDLRVYQAVCRRGVALEVAGVCKYEAHETSMRTLFDHIHRHPPAGYVSPGLDQFLLADRELWRLVSEQVQHKFAQTGGSSQVDAALQSACTAPSVVFHLFPLPRPPPPPKRTWDQMQDKGGGKGPKGGRKGGRGFGGKGPEKKGARSASNVPAALKGLSGTREGIRLCFNFNLAHGCTLECKDVNNNPTCARGAHLCMKCGGKHSAAVCEN